MPTRRKRIKGAEPLWYVEESPKIYFIASCPGLGEVVRSTGTANVIEARKRAQDLRKELLKYDPNYKPTLFRDVAEEYFRVKEPQWRDSTRENARDIIYQRLIPTFGDLRAEDINRKAWAAYTESFYKRNPGKFLFNTRKYMIGIMNYARSEGYLPAGHIEDRKWGGARQYPINDPESREGLVISPDHFRRIVQVAPPRLRVFCYHGYYMGMRPGEITGLERSRIFLSRPSIVLRADDVKTGSQTGHGREIAIAPEVLSLLSAWMLLTEPCEWLFVNDEGTGTVDHLRSAWRIAMERSGLSKIGYTPNDLRHSFITRKVLEEKRPIGEVAIYVGNSVAVIEDKYLHNRFELSRGVVEGTPAAVPAASGLVAQQLGSERPLMH